MYDDMATLSSIINNATLTAVSSVDGSGSGLDADLLDGINSSAFVRKQENVLYVAGVSTYNVESVSDVVDISYNIQPTTILFVFLNGVKQIEGTTSAYVKSGSQLTFSENLNIGDVVEVIIMEKTSE